MSDQFERLSRQGVVGDLRLRVIARILLFEPTKIRPDLFVEELDRVFPAEVLVGQEMVVVELDHPVIEAILAHHLGERGFEPLLTMLDGHLRLPFGRKLSGELEARLT